MPLRPGRGRHGDDHWPVAHAAQLTEDDAGRPPVLSLRNTPYVLSPLWLGPETDTLSGLNRAKAGLRSSPHRGMSRLRSRQFMRSIHNEQLRSDACRGAMRLDVVRALVAHARRQHECSAIFELGV